MTEQLNGHKTTIDAAQALFEYDWRGRLLFRATGVREVRMQLEEAQADAKGTQQRSSVFNGPVTIVARRSRTGRFPYAISVIPEQDPKSFIGINSVTASEAMSDLRVGISRVEDLFTRLPVKIKRRSIRVRRNNGII
jgi:hypothetical protein